MCRPDSDQERPAHRDRQWNEAIGEVLEMIAELNNRQMDDIQGIRQLPEIDSERPLRALRYC
ncbi:hypothetical protein GCM10008012_58090 [Rhizobium anhuiense]|nr:hypothetical protein GCM10008012_58090 [Rhizobium anhuiense]